MLHNKYNQLKVICKFKRELFISLVHFILDAKKHPAIQLEDAACFEFGLFLISCLNSVEYGQSDVPTRSEASRDDRRCVGF